MHRRRVVPLGIAVAISLILAACGEGASPSPAPASLTVKVGAAVTWANHDSTRSGSLTAGGAPDARTFDATGTFTYVCGIHATMKVTIVVEP